MFWHVILKVKCRRRHIILKQRLRGYSSAYTEVADGSFASDGHLL